MKSYQSLFIVLLFVIAGIVNPVPCKAYDVSYSSENFSYEFTPDSNHYSWRAIEHTEYYTRVFDIDAVYHKRPRNFHVEIQIHDVKTGDNCSGIIHEGTSSVDPVLYDTSCMDSSPHANVCHFVVYPLSCKTETAYNFCAISRTLPASLRTSLRQEYEAANNINPTAAPLPVSPKEGSIQNNPDRIKFELFLPFRYLKPCNNWDFRLELNRWDPESPRKNKWVSWHAGKPFVAYEGHNFDCRGMTYLKLKPGKYRFSCQAKNSEGWATPWSNWFEFSVKDTVSVDTEQAENFLSRPRIIVHPLSQNPPWHPGENHSISWSRTGFKVPGKVRIFLVRGKTQAALLNANRHEWSPPGGVANTGYWRRNLPKHIRPDEHYRVLIESVDNPEISGLSEFFPIRMRMHAGPLTPKGHALTLHPPASAQVAAQPGVKPGKKPGAAVKKLLLKSPRGMETFHIGETCLISWQSIGVKGNIRIILENRNGTKLTLNGMVGTPVSRKSFPWKIGADIKPGSMYRIYLRSVDGKVTSCKSGGFNIHRIDPDKAKKMLRKTNKPKLKKPPRGGHIQLH